MPLKIDLYDKKLLYLLDQEPRLPTSAIAKRVRRAKETISYRINRLTTQGPILYFYPLVNATKLGYNYYRIYLRMPRSTAAEEKRLIESLRQERRCANIQLLEGDYTISFLLIQPNIAELTTFLQRFVRSYGHLIEERALHVVTASNKLNQKLLLPGRTQRRRLDHSRGERLRIDELDRRLLELLGRNARLPVAKLARELDVEARRLRYRLKRLEEEGVIAGYSTALDLAQLRPLTVQANLVLNDLSAIQPIIEHFDQTNTCLFAYELLGRYDLSIQLHVEDDAQLKRILDRFKRRFKEAFQRLDTVRVYKEYDLNWSPFATEETP